MATYMIGIKSGVVSGLITGVLFAMILSTLFYATMSSVSPSSETSEKTISELAGFGNAASMPIKDAIIEIIAITLIVSIVVGILLGIATSATISVTRRGASFSIAILTVIALSAYYYQKYDEIITVLQYVRSGLPINKNLGILVILINTMPPIVFAAIEGMLINYFWGVYTVINIHTPAIKTDVPIQTNPVNSEYFQNTPAQVLQKAQKPQIAKSPQVVPASRPPQMQPSMLPALKPVPQKIIPNGLKEYVSECMKKGISEDDIKSMFIGYGYDANAINDLLAEKTDRGKKL